MKHFWLGLLVGISTTSCALAPNTVRTEVEHISHVSQHFGADRTNIGAETVNVIAQWRRGGAYLDIGEGVNVSPADGQPCNGGLCGPREVFTASVGYIWQVKP